MQDFLYKKETLLTPEVNNIQKIDFIFTKARAAYNLEEVLELTDDILDFAIILKYFRRKWKYKYVSLKEKKPLIMEALKLKCQEAILVQTISKTRNLIWKIEDFETGDLEVPYSQDGNTILTFLARYFSVKTHFLKKID